MAHGPLTAVFRKLPFGVVVVGVGLSVMLSMLALMAILDAGRVAHTRQGQDRALALRAHYPALASLFAQWDACNDRPVDPVRTAQICDHKMIKDAFVIEKTADMLAFLRERDALQEVAVVHAGEEK